MRPDGAPDANAADAACSGNTGASNCGEVSAFAVVAALGVPTNSSIGGGSVKVNLRDHGNDLGTYLACRSKAARSDGAKWKFDGIRQRLSTSSLT